MLTDASLPGIPESLRRAYPFRTRFLSVEGGRMSFVDEGGADALPLLLLHGNATWSWLYRKVIPKLAERFRVIAPDLVGFGLSDKPSTAGYHTLARHASNVTALANALGLTKLTLVANDWGGPIGLSYAAAHPENIQRILLMNTWASAPDAHFQWELSPSIRAARGGLASFFTNAPLRVVKEGSAKALPREALVGYKLSLTSKQSRDAVREFARRIPVGVSDPEYQSFQDLHAGLRKITAPVEILWGTRDPLFGGKLWPYLLRDAFPNAAEPDFLDNAGRLVPEDAPDRVIDKLLEIFKPKPATTKPALNILK
jgi:pimeloyl-ACP methyl ester carboxylesterase